MKWPKLKRDREGMTVKTRRPLRNGWMEIPAGTLCKVTYWHGGANLLSEPCSKCGLKVVISKVPESKLIPIANKEADGG